MFTLYMVSDFTLVIDSALRCGVVEKLLNQVDVGEQHPPAAVAREPKLIEGHALGVRVAN